MAGKLSEAYVEIQPDLSKFDNELRSGLSRSFDQAARFAATSAGEIETEFESAAKAAGKAIETQLGTSSTFADVEVKAAAAASEVETEFDTAAKAAANSIDGSLGSGSTFASVEQKAAAAADKVEQEFKTASAQVSPEFDKAGSDSGEGFLSSLGSITKGGVAAIGVAAGAAMTAGFMGAINQESATANLQAALGLSEAEAEAAGRAASNLYRSGWGEGLDDTAAAVEALIAEFPDLSGPALEEMGAQALAVAQAMDVDVAQAAASAGLAVRNGLAADGAEALDSLAAGLQQMPVQFRDELFEANNEYGKFFSQLNISGDEAFGLLANAAQQGMYGIDKTGDAIKDFTIRATDMSTTSVDAFNTIGLDAQTMANQILAGGDTARGAFDTIIGGLLGIEDPATQANTAIALFGTPIEDLSTAEIPGFLDSLASMDTAMGDTSGTATEMADTLSNTTANKMEEFKRKALGALADFVAEKVIPALERFKGWWERNWPKIQEAAQPVIDWFVNDVGPWLSDVWDGIVVGAQNVVAWFERNWPTIQAVIQTVMEGIRVAAAAVVSWFQRNWPTIKATVESVMNGIRIAAAAVVTWWQTNWPKIQQVIATVVDWIQNTAWPIIEQVMNWIVEQVGYVVDWWNENWPEIQETLQNVWDAIVRIIEVNVAIIQTAIEVLVKVLTFIWENWGEQILAVIETIWSYITTAIKTAIDLIRGIINFVTALITGDWSQAWEAIKTILQGIWDAMVNIVKTTFNLIKATIQSIWIAIQVIWDTAIAIVKAAWDTFWGALSGVVDTVKGAIETTVQAVWDIINNIFETMKATVQTIWDGFWNGLVMIVNGIKIGIGETVRALWTIISAPFEAGIAAAKLIWDGFWNGLSLVIDAAKRPIEVAVAAITAILDGIKRGIDAIISGWQWVERNVLGKDLNEGLAYGAGSGLDLTGLGDVVVHSGGIVPGPTGAEVPAILEAGELVVPRRKVASFARTAAGRELSRDEADVTGQVPPVAFYGGQTFVDGTDVEMVASKMYAAMAARRAA